jgi:hypothetical protein
MTIAILVVSALFDVAENSFGNRRAAVLCGLLVGLLPMLSAHAYIGVGEYAIFLCLLSFPFRTPKSWPGQVYNWCCFGVPAIALSVPQVLWLMRSKRSSFMKIDPIHTETDKSRILGFFRVWWGSLGSFVVVAIVLVFFVNDERQNHFYWPAVAIWIVSNLIRYQPGAMDNTKVFFSGWYSLACAAFANYIVVAWNAKRGYPRIAIALVLLGSFFSGGVCIWKAAFHPFPMFSKDEMELGLWIMENTKRETAVLAGGWHGNTMMSLGGRLVTMGYGGWVWTHGLSLDARRKLMNDLTKHRNETERFEKYKIEYAIWKSDDHSRAFNFPVPEINSRWVLVHYWDHLRVYRILKSL